MVQARLPRKNNPDAHYSNAVYKFLKQRAIKNRMNVAFYSADAKFKVSVGKLGFPVTPVTRGKKVVVGLNKTFRVADHDFSKLSFMWDAYLLHEIPDQETEISTLENNKDGNTIMAETFKNCYTGQVYDGIKNMVTEGKTAMRCTAEFSKIISQHFDVFSPRIYTYTDWSPEGKVNNLLVQKSYISIFLNHDIDKTLVAPTAANLSFQNLMQRCHAITNQGLQTIGVMRKSMASEMENYIKNANSNKEIRKLCSNIKNLLEELKESLKEPKHLIEDILQNFL